MISSTGILKLPEGQEEGEEGDLLEGRVLDEERYCKRNLKILLKMSVAIAGQLELMFSTVVSSGQM
jgi:hypothetical protein